MSKVPLITRVLRRKRLQLILQELEKSWRILDIGCGDGWLYKSLRAMGYNCIGVDLNSGDVFASSYNLPFRDNSFDCIIAIEVIEHLLPNAYNEIRRVFTRKLIITTPYPHTDLILKMLAFLRLIKSFTPHINPVKPEDLPFKLIKKKRIALLDMFAVYRKQ